ncbi:MAG: RsmD family RNA methyltransferase [Gemmatimonadaceae bacterium]|nr:RsmD family RNA methyltransferase [Gemmatimonadaceae bacterium]
MRIVGGKFAGRNLTSPSDYRVRPTAELVRVGLLKMLHADLEKARVLDLFAGTGALGLEAISRGARYADFVEIGPSSLHALKANIAALRLREKTRVFKKDALPFAAALEADRYDIVFVDPPYGSKMLDRVIESWQANKFSRILAVEHSTDHVLPRGYDKRIFEDTAVTIYRQEPPAPTPVVVPPVVVPPVVA